MTKLAAEVDPGLVIYKINHAHALELYSESDLEQPLPDIKIIARGTSSTQVAYIIYSKALPVGSQLTTMTIDLFLLETDYGKKDMMGFEQTTYPAVRYALLRPKLQQTMSIYPATEVGNALSAVLDYERLTPELALAHENKVLALLGWGFTQKQLPQFWITHWRRDEAMYTKKK